jgi:hypothetical protein
MARGGQITINASPRKGVLQWRGISKIWGFLPVGFNGSVSVLPGRWLQMKPKQGAAGIAGWNFSFAKPRNLYLTPRNKFSIQEEPPGFNRASGIQAHFLSARRQTVALGTKKTGSGAGFYNRDIKTTTS